MNQIKIATIEEELEMGHHHDGGDGVPQHVNSPRFSGPMTRRAQSFKRGGSGASSCGNNNVGVSAGDNNSGSSLRVHHEIDLHLSPRSEIASGSGPDLGFDSTALNRKHQTYGQLRERVVKGLLRKPMGSVVSDFSLREKKKLGHWMFFVFCGVCLFMGVFKICATGWFGSAIDGAASDQVPTFSKQDFECVNLSIACLIYIYHDNTRRNCPTPYPELIY